MKNERTREFYLILVAILSIFTSIVSEVLLTLFNSISSAMRIIVEGNAILASLLLLISLLKIKQKCTIIKFEFPAITLGGKEINITPGLLLLEANENNAVLVCKLSKDRKSLIISRRREGYWKSLGCNALVIWLSKIENVRNVVNPRNLEYLNHLIVQFMKEEGEKFVFLDGLEYLILENGFERVFKFLTTLKDYSLLNNTMIVIEVSSDTLDKKEVALLTREFHRLHENIQQKRGA